ncbi:GreA/GreB family elongation factor [Sandarakinorhabdus sp.]|uniref:GreA/GreB family elongation factor n=1 Tax=Sandarakinorhabdus sp. TaxID=1916663 RepID=UPI00286E5511|nr:GreA/GreB family elongation factor [Sandarakinorhabdus sp.]
MARATRDLRYWSARRASARLIDAPPGDGTAGFGSRVTIAHADGRQQVWHIVGDDEADPAKGRVSHVSPLARAVMGKSEGDTAMLAGREIEILAIA